MLGQEGHRYFFGFSIDVRGSEGIEAAHATANAVMPRREADDLLNVELGEVDDALEGDQGKLNA